jgi:hypothetical protein
MKHRRKGAGRPRTSRLTRAEQVRAAKQAQRRRQRAAGIAVVELRLPLAQASRLRAAAATPVFGKALDDMLREVVIDIDRWPKLRELAWNRALRFIPAADALSLYERNWRFVDPEELTSAEADLIERLKSRYGAGVLNV